MSESPIERANLVEIKTMLGTVLEKLNCPTLIESISGFVGALVGLV